MTLKVKLNTDSLKPGDHLDASKKRKSTQEDDESTLIGGDSELIRGLLEKINPSLLDLNVDADSPKKRNHSSLGGYINDGEGSLFLVYDTLRNGPIDTDKELAISVINSLVAQRKSKLPPAESIQLPETTVDSQLEKQQLRKARYALQQSWPGVDYFTQASDVDPAVASELTLGTATVVPIPENPSIKVPNAPKLKDISKPSPHTTINSSTYGTFRDKDVSHLYYGSNYSFGPCYDSTNATIPYSTSLNIATTSQMKTLEEPTMVQFHGEPVSAHENKEISKDELDNVNIEHLPEAYESLNRGYLETQAKLKRNAFLLAKLKSLEAQRLRSDIPNEPSEEEQEVAKKLTQSFTDMLVHEPPSQFYEVRQLHRLHPKPEMAHYYGTLHPEYTDMLVDNVSVRPTPAALRKRTK
ncbi:hypothetical protein E3Q03_01329 [Wallemia mellicola]|uniref:Uncharacterized protein n=1 Tax=Wallemia mellicola TaxID=1708541 RepID=A0AB74KL40_9BASI|nr:hypothetical protein E3Q03_01329 [Wallemia mellicola]